MDSLARKTMQIGGYYSMLADHGLRIVGLNTIYWVRMNVMMRVTLQAQFNQAVPDCTNASSPGALQFEWLNTTLSMAQEQGEAV